MISQNSLTLELEIEQLLSKPIKLEEFIDFLKKQSPDKIIQVADFLHFLFRNEIHAEHKLIFIEFSLLKFCMDLRLSNFLLDFAYFVKDSKNNLQKLALYVFLINQKLTEYMNFDSEKIKFELEKQANISKLKDPEKQISYELFKILPMGPSPNPINFYLDYSSSVLFENQESINDMIGVYKSLSTINSFSSYPDFLLPLPSEVEPSYNDLLTPFPLFLEKPILNPDFPQASIVTNILKNLKNATESDISVSL